MTVLFCGEKVQTEESDVDFDVNLLLVGISFLIAYHYAERYIFILYYYKNKNWLQFLFIVKAAVLKQQISKFYPQIQRTADSFYIYERPLTEVNVIAIFCALNLRIKF